MTTPYATPAPATLTVLDPPNPAFGESAGFVRMMQMLARIDDCIVASHSLAAHLGADRPPHTASTAEGLTRYGPGEFFDMWRAWRAIHRLRDAGELHRDAIAPAPAGRTGTTP